MKPCPCGYHGDQQHSCACNPLDVQRYLGRVSGPLLDRIDLYLEVPAVKYRELTERDAGEPSTTIRERVDRARAVQRARFAGRPGIFANAHMAPRDIRARCRGATAHRSRASVPSPQYFTASAIAFPNSSCRGSVAVALRQHVGIAAGIPASRQASQ